MVKVTASADRPDADGKQSVTISLAIDKGWHTYANPVGLSDLADVQTTVHKDSDWRLANTDWRTAALR